MNDRISRKASDKLQIKLSSEWYIECDDDHVNEVLERKLKRLESVVELLTKDLSNLQERLKMFINEDGEQLVDIKEELPENVPIKGSRRIAHKPLFPEDKKVNKKVGFHASVQETPARERLMSLLPDEIQKALQKMEIEQELEIDESETRTTDSRKVSQFKASRLANQMK